jgi:signal transduction histidine kinase
VWTSTSKYAFSTTAWASRPNIHSKVFVAFRRLHGRKIPGTGIELAICRRVVERYGNHIWVESQLGHGANFIFTLPANLIAPQQFKRDN